MTECERFVAEGKFSEDFFKEEIRCDFLVTKERKKIWAVVLDLLCQVDNMCKKYNLRYFLNSGSLLGAVRHKGFIPWDDDIDIEMPREDYEILLSHSDEFENPYFLQTPYTDPNCFYSFAKLRNSNTTGISKMFVHQEMNQGLFLDIFPTDRWLKSDSRSFEEIKWLNCENSTYMRMKNPNLDDENIERVRNWSGIKPLYAYELIQKLAMQYKDDERADSIMVAVSTIIGKYSKKIKDPECYSQSILCEFEGFEFPIPKGYDIILTGLYGDYMKFPPIEQRGGHVANGAVFLPDVPYENYINLYMNDLTGEIRR